ncbi:MAG: prolyl-tRNA synthetase associated domain-containing protein [Firmicutes bacterium]|nr:prolyl-tRNA synthetase associated domain-containing protein [Bacillota bacterium]
MYGKQEIYDLLNEKKIEYEAVEHIAVYTIEEMMALDLPNEDIIAKNLFLRDDKKKNYYLLTVREDKRVNLKELRSILGSRPLSFASENDLQKYLGLQRGAVTPLGVLNDSEHAVKVYIDKEFEDRSLGIHPNDNTASIWLETKVLAALLKEAGAEVEYIEL